MPRPGVTAGRGSGHSSPLHSSLSWPGDGGGGAIVARWRQILHAGTEQGVGVTRAGITGPAIDITRPRAQSPEAAAQISYRRSAGPRRRVRGDAMSPLSTAVPKRRRVEAKAGVEAEIDA